MSQPPLPGQVVHPHRSDRRLVPGLTSPFPLIDQVPALFAEDAFLQRMLPALDEVIAPIISVLDCFYAYLDPQTAPPDMVRYLGSWLLAFYPMEANEDTLRFLVSTAVARARWRGTAEALREYLVPREVRSVTIDDPGGTFVSAYATDPEQWPPTPEPRVVITCELWTDEDVAPARIDRLVRVLIPAHVYYELRVIHPPPSDSTPVELHPQNSPPGAAIAGSFQDFEDPGYA